MNPKFKKLYSSVMRLQQRLFESLDELENEAKSATSVQEAMNNRFAMYHVQRLAKQLKKQCAELERLTIMQAVAWVFTSKTPTPVRTEYATFSPKIEEVPTLPTRHDNPERYAACLEALGIPPHAQDKVQLHWPGIEAWIEQESAEGYSIPECFMVGKKNARYSCRVSAKRKEVLEDDNNANNQ